MNNPVSLMHCRHIDKTYHLGGQEVHALTNINLTINHGDAIAILGTSGSGKSTLMNILGCLDSPSTGDYYLNGQCVSKLSHQALATIRNRHIGFIFQSFHLLDYQNALENVALPLVFSNTPTKERKNRATMALERVGLADRLNHKPQELSGGQRQRVAIARALVTEPDVILADEPTGNLDTKSGQDILSIFSEMSQDGKTLVMVTHDPKMAEKQQRVIHISDGRIISDDHK